MRARKKSEKICFLCLSSTTEPVNCARNVKPEVKLLLQYLLDIKSPKYVQLTKDIGGGDGEKGSSLNIYYCGNCRSTLKIIGDLHKTLEVTQLKLIHELKSVKLKILNEVTTKSAEHLKSLSPKFQEIIPVFHHAIREKENLGGVSIPLIYLEKYLPGTSTSVPLQPAVQEPQTSELQQDQNQDPPPIIKNESPDLFDNDDLSDSHFDDLWNNAPTKQEDNPSEDPPPPQPSNSKPKLKRKSKSTPSSKISPPPKKLRGKYKTKPKKEKPTPTSTLPKKPRGRPRLTSTTQLLSKPQRPPRPNRTPRRRRPLICLLCSYKTLYPYTFENHLRSHEEQASISPIIPPSPCPSCPKTFHIPQSLQFHLEGHSSHSPTPRTILCDYCNVFIPYSEIHPHMSSHSPPLPKIFTCPHCSHCSSTRLKFLAHLKVHGKGHLPCDLCPSIFTIQCKLLEHLHKVHQAIQKIPCDFPSCTKTFYDPQHLKVHQNVHLNPYSCQTCGKAYPDDYKLKVHLRTHTGEKPYKCEECPDDGQNGEPVNFLSKACLIRHQIKYHGRSKYKCDYCDKEYGDKGMLRVHLTIHEGNGIPCGKCEKVLGSKTLWRRHQLVHSEEKEVICDECGKGFKCAYALKLHKQSHKGDGDKGWICKVCGKAFVIKKYLADHERTHTGERPFVCSMCGKAFSQHGSLCMHYKKFHPNNKTENGNKFPGEKRKKGGNSEMDNDRERREINCGQLVFKEDSYGDNDN